jgi:hypothetical protein
MESTEIIGYAGALAVGLVLGLIGSGGSIMTVPILSYLFHINPITTTAYSLFIVGTSASVGSIRFLKHGMIDMKIALWFALPALTVIYTVRNFLIHRLPENIVLNDLLLFDRDRAIMVLFALILILASVSLIYFKSETLEKAPETAPRPLLLAGMGVFVGLITGLVGVGGGFMIIPALVLFAGLPMMKGVATSLFIIAVNSMIGFTGNLGRMEIDWYFLLSFSAISMLGILVGIRMSSFFPANHLKTAFGWLCLATAFLILYHELFT